MSWNTAELGDLCEIQNGSTPLRSNKDFWENGTISWFTIEDIRNFGRIIHATNQHVTLKALEETSLKVVPSDSILLCCTASVGEYAITKIPLAMNQQFNALIIKDKKVLLPEYLLYFCSTLKNKLIAVSGSVTINFVAISKLKKLKIHYPSIEIQKKIVDKLDAIFGQIDNAIVNTEINVKNAELLFKCYLTEAFREISNAHNQTLLKDICVFENGDRGKNYPSKKHQIESGIPFINAGDLTDSPNISSNGMAYISEQRFNLLGAGKVKSGDILFCLRGSLGKCGIVENIDKGAIASSLVIIRPIQDRSVSKFIYWFLKSNLCAGQIDATKGGAAQPNLSAKSVMNFSLPDIVIEKQEIIVEKIEELFKKSSDLAALNLKKIALLKSLRNVTLTQAFNGELVKE